MSALYVILGLAVLLPLSGLVDLMLSAQRYDVSAGLEAATKSERIAAVEHLFYQGIASYASALQASSGVAPTIDATTLCPTFGSSSLLQPLAAAGSQTLMGGCSYVSTSSPYVRLEDVKSTVLSSSSTSLSLAPATIVISQACVVATPQDSCLSAYSP